MIPRGEKVIIGGDLMVTWVEMKMTIERFMEGMDSRKLIIRVSLFYNSL